MKIKKKSLLSHKLALKHTVHTLKDRRSLGKQEEAAVGEKGAEEHAGLRFGVDVKGSATHSESRSKRREKKQTQETCPQKLTLEGW